ncbi:MAG: formate dehydrogenase accessory sulfurtransferase FdhD [Sulfobacillus benefaciens]|uniref:Sulfur carrier protein FdhD n=1 Tax=Sulfobacillus benefaciens TaxID=453960 RepID=A0A2T2XKE0_9FIRM|nr:MAG: formate dehydrogenase accessory sulfurtransferase FdhD [Sulfobacillus benefaciens]
MVEVISQTRYRFHDGIWSREPAEVVREAPITLWVNGREIATIIATPNDIEELICGFLAMEGIITQRSQITIFQYHEDDQQVWVRIPNANEERLLHFARPTLSGCCGRGRPSLYFANDQDLAPISGALTPHLSPATVATLFSRLNQVTQQQHSGGLHAAGLGSQDGALRVARMDVGRHNALDKVYGWSLIQQQDIRSLVVVFSGRLSSEVLIKVARMGIGIVISNAAPTSLGIELATMLGITTVGFVRSHELSVYSYPERIQS